MEVPTPREIYYEEQLWEVFELKNRYNSPSLEAVLPCFDELARHASASRYLDGLHDRGDATLLDNARKVFGYLPPHTIMEHYGEAVLAWAAVNVYESAVREDLTSALTRLAGYDRTMFEKSRNWCKEQLQSQKVHEVLRQYELLDTLLYGGLKDIALSAILQQGAKPGVTLSDKRLEDYALMVVQTQGSAADGQVDGWYAKQIEPRVVYNMWLDAPVGFTLNYKGKPNALVGLGIASEHELMVYQLQGVRAEIIKPGSADSRYCDVVGVKASRGLMPLDWRYCMVHIAEEVALQLNMQSIGIQAGVHNKWSRIVYTNEDEPRLSKAAAQAAYDMPAQQLGFVRSEEDGNWHKTLPKQTFI